MAMDVDIRFATAEARAAFAQELSAFIAKLARNITAQKDAPSA